MSRRTSAGQVLPLIAALALAVAPASADRLHLDGGGTIETARWWVEGDRLLYETAVGTVGLPRSIVLQIEKTGAASSAAAAPPPAATSDATPAAPARDGPPAGTVEVPIELGRVLTGARTALDGGDYEKAAALYQQALQDADPDLQLPRIGYALSYMALGRDELALSMVLEGLARDPREPALLELKGDLHNRRELVQDALRAWDEAFRVSPNDRLRAKILKAERELNAARYYSFSTTAHFNMRYDGEVDADLATAVSDYLEEQFWEMSRAFVHTPRQPITVLLYPSQEFRDVTQTPEWVGGMYDGKIRVPLGGLRRLNPQAQAVLIHELTHAIVHAKSRGRCPRWLQEGLAQRSEGRRLSAAGRNHIVQRLSGTDAAKWEAGGFSYPIALSLIHYLEARRDLGGLVELLEQLGEGRSMDEALDAVFGVTYERLCRDWAAWFLAEESVR